MFLSVWAEAAIIFVGNCVLILANGDNKELASWAYCSCPDATSWVCQEPSHEAGSPEKIVFNILEDRFLEMDEAPGNTVR